MTNADKLELHCMENEIDLRRHSDDHYSLFRGDYQIDYYPNKSEYHDIVRGKKALCNVACLVDLFAWS